MFPQFNIHSSPLLIFVAQGLIFAFLLLFRYRKQRMIADLLIAIFLIIMAYHRTAYTIGFMGWYDTFKNTKVNYFLISLGLAFGPLIYLYVRTTLKAPFKFRKSDWLHFLPAGLFVIYRLVLLLHDSQQADWDTGYEGDWQQNFHMVYVSPLLNLLEYSSQLLYLAFSIQLFVQYKQKIKQFFSNTYKVELNWLRLFLAIFCFLFIYDTLTDLVDAYITELHYTHKWWVHLFYSIAIVYLGVKAYYTDLKGLQQLTFEIEKEVVPEKEIKSNDYEKEKAALEGFIQKGEVYLKPDFTVKDLAKGMRMSIHQVSEIINNGYGVNFSEFINGYRVEEAKKQLINPENSHLSILAIAYDCGFNSKATFNRVFKQLSGVSPSEFRKNQSI